MTLLASTIALTLSFYSGQAPRKDHNLIKFELRSAERDPGKELIEALVPKSDQRIFLHKEVLITNVDIVEAQAVEDTSGFVLTGRFSDKVWITGKFTREEAEKIADGIKRK
jgi:hypothetical protein